MKRIILTLLACLLTALGVRGATLDFNGKIQGAFGVSPGNVHTMDYYFITAMVGGTFTGSLCLSAIPADGGGTSLDFGIFRTSLNSFGEYEIVAGFGLRTHAPCDSQTFTLAAGEYFIAASPGSTQWDGGQGTIDDTSRSQKYFESFTYSAQLTGEVRLNAVWLGQPDGTFLRTAIPEPGVLTLLLSAVLTQCLTRQKFPA